MDPNPADRPSHVFNYEQQNPSQPKKQEYTKLLVQGCGLFALGVLILIVAAVGVFIAMFLFGSGS